MSAGALRAAAKERERLRAKRFGAPTTLRGWLLLLVTLPCFVMIRLLGRLGVDVMTYPDHFGHQTIDVEYYLRTNSRRLFRPIYLRSRHVPNAFLLQKHEQQATILSLRPIFMRYFRVAEKQCIRVLGRSLFRSVALDYVLQDGETWTELVPTITFTEEEKVRGRRLFELLGLEPRGYVCFHCRQAAYALQNNPDLFNQRGSPTGSARHVALFEDSWFQQFRNSDFTDYGPAVAALGPHGLKAVRVGAAVEGDVTDMPNLVDFSGLYRDSLGEEAAFADAWLMANARFYVGTSSGVTAFAYIFNLPIVWVNSFPWPWGHAPARQGSLYLSKLVTVAGETLSFPELIEFSRTHDWRSLYDNATIERLGWQVVDNSPEEIATVVEEMVLNLAGDSSLDRHDEARQAKLLAYFEPGMPMYGTYARMGRAFLAKHQRLLDPR